MGRALLFGIIMLFAGCGTRPDIVSTEKKAGDTYSADEVRHMTVDQPFLISGDYFRKRNQESDIDVGKLFSGSDEKAGEKPASPPAPAPKSTEKTAAVASAPQNVPRPPEVSREDVHFPVKIGMIIDKDQVSQAAAERLSAAVVTAAADLPLILADSDQVEEVMRRSVCRPKDLACLCGALSIYPGLRMVLLAERLDLPDTWPGEISFRLSLVDAGIRYRYPMMDGTVPVQRSEDVAPALAGVMNRVFAFAVKKASLMPWFCKPFGMESGEWYVSAGARSGIAAGDVLKIVGQGKTIKSPTGYPAGWIPGEVKGKVAVKTLFGTDFAVVRLLEGDAPEAEDYLMRP